MLGAKVQAAAGVLVVRLSDLADGRHHHVPDPYPVTTVVLGGLSDDHQPHRHLRCELATSARPSTLQDRMADAARVMVNAERSRLAQEVEVDEFELGGAEPGRRGGRRREAKAVKAIIAIEIRGAGSGRVRIQTIADASAETVGEFVKNYVAPGAILHTDGWSSYKPLGRVGYDHRPRSQLKAKREGDIEPVMPRAHRAISNLKAWQRGTHRWVSCEHTQAYLDEYVFRHNRRGNPMAAFQRLLGLGTAHEPVPRQQIIAEGPGPRPRRNRS